MNSVFSVYKLRFHSPLHVGEEGTEDISKVVHSDTIISAIYTVALKTIPSFCEDLINGSVKISSAFPFFDGETPEYFLPKPLFSVNKLFDIDKKDCMLRKGLKNLSFIPVDWFNQILNGKKCENFSNLANLIDDVRNKLGEVFKIHTTPKVSLDRVTQDSNLYHYSEMHFKKGGLYIITEIQNENVKREFEGLLKLLGDEGLGGKRTAGCGLFDIETDKIKLEIPNNAKRYLLLSVYWPPKGEREKLDLEKSSYKLLRRAGWLLLDDGRSFRRRPVWLFQEGSILNFKPGGGVIDVTPDVVGNKRVYRFGFAFCLPMQLSEKQKGEEA